MSNVYYGPENFGLEVVAEVDPEEAYQFDTVVVWRHKETGGLYAAHDAGCSCPTPFEGYNSLADLVQVRSLADVDPLLAETYGISAYEIAHFRDKIGAALGVTA